MSRARILQNGILLIAFAFVCIVGMEFLAINIGQPKPIIHGYRVQAVFSDADGIPTAADVRVSGVVVGKVTGINHDPAHPGATVATMEINDSRADPVYTNGFAKVRPKTLLGEKYVDLTVGNTRGEAIPDMGMLPQARTSKVVENDEIFNAFDAKTRAQQQQVLKALDAATKERGGDVQAILPQLDTVVQNLDPVAQVYTKDDPAVRNIFQNFDTLLRALADEHVQLGGLLANGNVALGAIAQRDQSLATTLQEFSNVATEFNTAIQPTVQAQRDALTRLAPTLDSQKTFLSLIEDPQPGCNNKPCGIDELFTGTLLGQINYPSDQLTVTSANGQAVTREWDSMFQYPTDQYHSSSNPKTHAALNVQFSWHCDTVSTTLQNLFAGSSSPTGQDVAKLIDTACKSTLGQNHPNSTTSTNASGQPATDAALITELQQ